MKGPGIKDYLEYIQEMKVTAQNQHQEYLEVTSKNIHEKLSPMHATMPTCCQALYKVMLAGDQIMQRPKGNTGFGSHLSVRFYLHDLDTRERMFPNKKRGRPAKSPEEKLAAKKAKMKRNTEDLSNLIKAWLSEHGWEYIEQKEIIEAHCKNEKWIINVQGIKRGRKQPLPVKLSEVIKQIEDTSTHYSLAFNDSLTYRRQWNEIPNVVKKSLNMSVILADKKGNIIEL